MVLLHQLRSNAMQNCPFKSLRRMMKPSCTTKDSSSRYLNIWDAMIGLCLPKKFRFNEEEGDDAHTERGRTLLRQEQACCHSYSKAIWKYTAYTLHPLEIGAQYIKARCVEHWRTTNKFQILERHQEYVQSRVCCMIYECWPEFRLGPGCKSKGTASR